MIARITHGIFGSSKPWTPIKLSNIKAWYRSDEVTLTANQCSWTDKTGNGFVLQRPVPGTLGGAIVKNTAVLNGFDTYSYTNNAPSADTKSTVTGLTTPYTIFSVMRTDIPNVPIIIGGTILQEVGGGRRLINGSFGSTYIVVPNPSSYYLLTMVVNDVNSLLIVNKHTPSSQVLTGSVQSDSDLFINVFLSGGTATTFVEMAIMNGVATAGEILHMQNYVTNRYAITM